MKNKKSHSYEDAKKSTLEYFDNDELSSDIFLSKYALKDKDNNYMELNPSDMHARLAKSFAEVECNYENPMSVHEIYRLFKDFKHIVPQGSPMSGIGNELQIQSISNCFVIESPVDSYGGIFKTDQEQAQIMKRRGGVGFDLSNLRPKDLLTSNAAKTTSGIVPFAERFSNTCREVGQDGRRGALMESISVHHPQIMDFIKMKRNLDKVTGANISIRVTDEFMNAVENKTDFNLRWPVDSTDPEISEFTSAVDVWHEIIKSAHISAEPGVLYWDTALRMTPSDIYEAAGFRSISTNPCGEIILSSYDSCRLMLINLTTFVVNKWGEEAYFDFDKFATITIKAQRLMDDMIDIELAQIDKIINKINKDPESEEVKRSEKSLWLKIKKAATDGRRTGLGITGLGDTLAMLNHVYGSSDSINMTEEIYKALAVNSYISSIELAKERGAFPVYDWELEKDHPFLNRIYDELPKMYQEMWRQYGRRNIANTTTAPAGSVSCLTKTTSGIEPVFKLFYTRRKKINANDSNKDVTVDYIDDLGDKWQEYNVYHHGFKEYLAFEGINIDMSDTETLQRAISYSPYGGATANEIDWRAKVKMQSVAQKWVCHAISNTTNLPEDVDIETVKDLYMLGWKLGCKGITIYREGSRSGVLVESGSKKEASSIKEVHATKRIDVMECDIYHTSVREDQWVILIGLLDGKPYEVFGGKAETIELPRKFKKGKLRKRHRKSVNSKYDLIIGDEDPIVINDIVNVFDNPNNAGYTRLISTSLRHGVPTRFIVEQMQKDKEMDMFSFSKTVSRCLKSYIIDGTKSSSKVCDNCGSKDGLTYQEGCESCISCGASKCQ